MEKGKKYFVNVVVNGTVWDCLDIFQADNINDDHHAKAHALECANFYNEDQEWFDDFSDNRFDMKTTWSVEVCIGDTK